MLAAVGPMQFEVAVHRLENEFGAPARLDRLSYSLARRTDAATAEALRAGRGFEVLTRHSDGALLVLFEDVWRLRALQREQPASSSSRSWPPRTDPISRPFSPETPKTFPCLPGRPAVNTP